MSKSRMKKVVSIALSLVMMFLCFVPALAAETDTEKATPVLFISGFSEYTLVDIDGEAVFPPSTARITAAVQGCIQPIGKLIAGDYDAFCEGAFPAVNDLFSPISCNPDGTVADQTVKLANQFTESVDHYDLENDVMGPQTLDNVIVKALVDKVGANNLYVYGLDWRKSMGELSADINSYVEKMKADKGVDKVSLVGHSMGGAVLAAYLGNYGYDSVSNITMLNSAYTGLEMVGQLFTGSIQIDAPSLLNLITENLGSDVLSNVIDSTKLLTLAVPKLQEFLETQTSDGSGRTYKDRLFSECLIPSFGYDTGIWAFVPDNYYEDAKATMKAYMAQDQKGKGATESQISQNWKTFEAKIDEYHNTQANIKNILTDAKASGIILSVFSSYNFTIAPVTAAYALTSDGVIETIRTSGGAVCADQGKTLGEGYSQVNDKSHNHLSADNMIDASTCFFPENTWFIKNYQHAGFNYDKNGCDLYVRAITAKEQPTVDTWQEYPQFLVYNKATRYISPLDEKLGDVDFDGAITPVDARIVLRYTNGLETLSEAAKHVADTNQSGDVSKFDAQYILNSYAGVA